MTDANPQELTLTPKLVINPRERVDRPAPRIDCDGQKHRSLTRDGRDKLAPGITHRRYDKGGNPDTDHCGRSPPQPHRYVSLCGRAA